MEKNNFRPLRSLFADRGHQNIWPSFRSPLSVEDFSSMNAPFFSSVSSPASNPYNSANRFDQTRNLNQDVTPLLNPSDNDLTQRCGGKKFLVFDQSGERTTAMVLTSGPIHGAFVVPNTLKPFDFKKEEPRNGDFDRPLMGDEDIEKDDSKDVKEDEMYEEDTEELNALLFSDSDDYYEGEDDEVASTGHSPSKMTDGLAEEVDSFAGWDKRRKLSNGEVLITTSNCCHDKGFSYESYARSALEDGAESVCNDKKTVQELGSSVSRGKRSRKGEILESVSILQTIVPLSNGKRDPLSVIDEAIRYLKTLKVEAMALGVEPSL